MPPTPIWFSGLPAVAGFLANRVLRREGELRLTPTSANGQPAFVVHERAGSGRYEPHGVHVLTLIGNKVARITAFNDPSLVPTFTPAPGSVDATRELL
jgi:RNA polymerase sigma-70 factor (ECF subfamily)